MRLIDADELRKSLYNGGENFDRVHGNKHFIYGIETAIEAVDNAPTIDPVKRGRWIVHEGTQYDWYQCDKCEYATYDDTNFCPYCGADMRGVK